MDEEREMCGLCGFPLESFKHRAYRDKQLGGHAPTEEPVTKPARKTKKAEG